MVKKRVVRKTETLHYLDLRGDLDDVVDTLTRLRDRYKGRKAELILKTERGSACYASYPRKEVQQMEQDIVNQVSIVASISYNVVEEVSE